MKLNWNFLGGQGVQNKKPSVGGVWIFSGTAQYDSTRNFHNQIDHFIMLDISIS